MMLLRLGIAGDDPDSQQQVITEVRARWRRTSRASSSCRSTASAPRCRASSCASGVLAVVLSFVGIGIYVWLRFEWQFALGAVASRSCTTRSSTAGIFSMLQLEFNLTIIAAILTVLGYSINDTVVVFDRVREVLRKYKKMPLPEVMNLALNETLSRTVMTVDDDADRARRHPALRRADGLGLRLRGDLRRRLPAPTPRSTSRAPSCSTSASSATGRRRPRRGPAGARRA